MAIEISSAVKKCGPRGRSESQVLAELGDQAGAEGMAWPNLATLAAACRLSVKQVERIIASLERDRWLTVCRKATLPAELDPEQRFAQGKQSIYTIDIARLGLTPETAPRLFKRQRFDPRKSTDKMSAESRASVGKPLPKAKAAPRASNRAGEASGRSTGATRPHESADILSDENSGAGKFSADNPQPTQQTNSSGSADISTRLSGHLPLRTVGSKPEKPEEPDSKPEGENQAPPTPPQAGGSGNSKISHSENQPAEAERWAMLKKILRRDLHDDAPLAGPKNFVELQAGQDDYNSAFRDMSLDEPVHVTWRDEFRDQQIAYFTVCHPDPPLLDRAIRKYEKRLAKAAHQAFEIPGRVEIKFQICEGGVATRETAGPGVGHLPSTPPLQNSPEEETR
jgi:helix-turn-helix protein